MTGRWERWLRVPEPWEVAAWLRQASDWLRVRLRQPRTQLLLALLALAALLRLTYLDLIPFGPAQLAPLRQALEIRMLGSLPAAGPPQAGQPAAVGVAGPPLLSYALAIPVLFSRDPRLAVALVVLAHLAALALLFVAARQQWGLRVAGLAAALYSVNPWAVLWARDLSPESLLLPLATVLLVTLVWAIADRRPWAWPLALAALGLALNASLYGLPLALMVAALALAYRRRVAWPHFLLGVAILALVCLPYLNHDNAQRFRGLRSAAAQLWRGSS
ncbi:MAG: glycosyltransferase family 39 protein, partial [Chloroflexota bacterium]